MKTWMKVLSIAAVASGLFTFIWKNRKKAAIH